MDPQKLMVSGSALRSNRFWTSGYPTCNHSVILDLSFLVLDQEMATKWLHNLLPGLILGVLCTIY